MSSKTREIVYDDAFFDLNEHDILASARIVVPWLLNLVSVESVVDVGCGRGAWLRVIEDNGVKIVRGLDGHYINRAKLLIDPTCFTPVDLAQPFEIDGCYDLAVCLEVVEHLPAKVARSMIHALTAAAPLVLFSAAIPGQGGNGHISEQWPVYWQRVFASRGFKRLDVIRPHIWLDKRVRWWYRQNIFLYASDTAIAKSPALQDEARRTESAELELIHRDILGHYTSFRGILKEVPRVALRALKNRLEWLVGTSTKSA